MLEKPKTFFAIHLFESKSYEDSAGKLEVREPMVQSGLLGEHQTYHFGWQEQDSIDLVEGSVNKCAEIVAMLPVVVYGAGAHTTQYWPQLSKLNIVALADKNSQLWGSQVNGVTVISPAEIASYSAHVLISSRAYEENIYSELSSKYPNLTLHKLYGAEFMAASLELWCQKLEQQVIDFKPDLLVHTPTHVKENIPKAVFIRLKSKLPSLKILTIWWDYDEENEAAGYLDYEREVLSYADLVIENSNATRLIKMHKNQQPYHRHSNVHKVIFHPTWFDPTLFYDEQCQKKPIKIALFGSIVGDRQYWVDLLSARYGSDFHHFGGVSGEQRNPIPIAEYAKMLRQTHIVINTQTYGFRSQCKGKVRETLQAGGVLLEQDNLETRSFEQLYPDIKINYFDSEASLISRIDSLLAQGVNVQKAVHADKLCTNWTRRVLEQL